jgi:DNA (cytosine-5)-methyltransferase 1
MTVVDKQSKPTYTIPTMKSLQTLETNGLNVVSTFSGCGGTCLGYKMAGFNVLWASEFIPAAQEVYKLNHPNTILDTRDIRQVTGKDILDAIGLSRGEVDILEGSPPCASFSTAGKREKKWGQVVKYSDTHQRVDDLFDEFIRIVDEVQPKVFVAENVSGLVKGMAKGYFKAILQKMRTLNYTVEVKLLNAAWLGVPQARERLFFIGVRTDLNKSPVFPKPLPYYYTLGDVLPYVQKVKLGGKPNSWGRASSRPSPTIAQSSATRSESAYLDGGGWIETGSSLRQKNGELYATGKEWDNLREGEHSKKYLDMTRTSRQRPSPTVSATGGSAGSASITHPTERRKFTIEELKLISSFPEDFQITGNFAKQWERIGRAVPPFMARAIAETIRDRILFEEVIDEH